MSAINQLVPLTMTNAKKSNKPCLNPTIEFLFEKKKATERNYIRSKNTSLLTELIAVTEEIGVTAKTARNNFYRERINEALDTKQDIWRELTVINYSYLLLKKNFKVFHITI